MKKYPKMTFAALSAIALNFSCLATSHPLKHSDNKGTHNNIHYQNLTPLSTEEQISILKHAITVSDVSLTKNILTGRIKKIGQSYYHTPSGGRFFAPMSDLQFEELQIFSLDNIRRANDSCNSVEAKRKIFALITSKFFKVTNNKEQVSKTTASKVYSNRDSFIADELAELIDLIPSPASKRAFVRHFFNYAKQDNNIGKYEDTFWALETTLFGIKIFTNQPWLQPFIREYLEQMLSKKLNNYIPPIGFIKDVAPDLYNEKLPLFLKRCIIDAADTTIVFLLPLDEDDTPSDALRLSAGYLNLALEKYHSGTILSHIASYIDTSSDLTNVALTLAKFTQEECQETLKCIKNANRVLYHSILKALQRLGY